jgi:hypothetical protein
MSDIVYVTVSEPSPIRVSVSAPETITVNFYTISNDLTNWFGDQTANSSWRFQNSSGTLKLQARVAGAWVDVGDWGLP